MSDSPALPPTEEQQAEPPSPPPERPARRPLLPWLTAAGFLLLAAAIIWLWRHPVIPPASTEATDSLTRQVAALEERVSRLEQRPMPSAPDLGPLNARMTALEQRPGPQAPPGAAPAALGPLEARVGIAGAATAARPPALDNPAHGTGGEAAAGRRRTFHADGLAGERGPHHADRSDAPGGRGHRCGETRCGRSRRPRWLSRRDRSWAIFPARLLRLPGSPMLPLRPWPACALLSRQLRARRSGHLGRPLTGSR